MAFLAAAPEAEAAAGAVATKAKGVVSKAKGKGKGKPGPLRHQPNNLNDLPADWHEEELEARKADARWVADERKAGRDPDRSTVSGEESAPSSSSSSSKAPAAPLFTVGPADKWHTGSGLVLGSVAWVLFMNFMQGGMPQVRRWGAAKFLNRTPQVGGTK